MKKSQKAGSASKNKFGKVFLCVVLAAALTALLCSCTVDELLEIADSVAREYYASERAAQSATEEIIATEATTEPTEPATEATTEATTAEAISAGTSFAMPFADKAHGGVNYSVTQYFSSTHGGIDFGVYWGTPILAATDGKVVYAYNDGDISSTSGDLRWTYGTFVVVESTDGMYRTYYAHMRSKTVNVGDTVRQGDIVGYCGNTGRVSSSSTGPYAGTHLHFEVRVKSGSTFVKDDPKNYLPWWN